MHDKRLRDHVMAELAFDPTIDALHIGVAVDGGIVSLSGWVRSFAEKTAAEDAVLRIKGVTGLAEALQIVIPEARRADDDALARQALCIIEWSTHDPAAGIKVKAERGWLTLSGDCDSYFLGHAAAAAVRKLVGVTGVTNLINIKPVVEATNVAAQIRQVFERSNLEDWQTIQVDAFGGRVTMVGTVQSLKESLLAERAAWSVPGVSYVENRMAISGR